MRTVINVRCKDQILSYIKMPLVTSGNINEDKIKFEFCPMWDGFTKTAVFYRNEADVYHVLLEEDNSCLIPPEVLTTPGTLHFGVFGVLDDRVRTSEVIQYTVKRGAITEATKISDPTPDIYTQILTTIKNMKDEIENNSITTEHLADGAVTPEKLSQIYATEDYVDNKFVVDSMATENSTNLITSGAVFEAINEIEVTGSQIQVDYAENDDTSVSYIQNRPFYDTRKFEDVESSKKLAIATNKELKEVLIQIVKVANLPCSPNELLDEIEYIVVDGSSSHIKVDNAEQYRIGSNSYFFTGGAFLIDETDVNRTFTEEDPLFGETVFPEPGFYVVHYMLFSLGSSKIKFKGLKQLDNKFLNIDTNPKEDSENPISSGAAFKMKQNLESKNENNEEKLAAFEEQMNSFQEQLNTKVDGMQADYLQNDSSMPDYIKNRLVYSEPLYENSEINIPDYTGTEVCTNTGSTSFIPHTKFVKIAELSPVTEDTLSFVSIITDRNDNPILFDIELEIGMQGTAYTGLKYIAMQNGGRIIEVKEPNHVSAYFNFDYGFVFPETGLYALVENLEYERYDPMDGEYNGDDWAHKISKIVFNDVIYPLEEKFLPETFQGLPQKVENNKMGFNEIKTNVETLEDTVNEQGEKLTKAQTDISDLKNRESMSHTLSLSKPTTSNDVIVLSQDRDTPIGYLYINGKSRADLEVVDENGNTLIDFSSVTPYEHIKINMPPETFDEDLISACKSKLMAANRIAGIRGAKHAHIGLVICDETKSNGVRILYDSLRLIDNTPCLVLTKIEEGIDTVEFHYLFEGTPLDDTYENLIETSGWYRLVDGVYTKASSDDLSVFVMEFDKAYVLDYWVTMDEDSYNAAVAYPLAVKYPMLMAEAIAGFVTMFTTAGLYKTKNLAPRSSLGWENFATEMSDDSITTEKLADGAVTPEKLSQSYATEEYVDEKVATIETLGSSVQPDHNQNDPTQPDYIKNRLAYRCRKFEDMEATEYPEPILGVVRIEEDGEIYQEPMCLKFSELPENVTPYEIIEELIGLSFMGEDMRLDDSEMLQHIKLEKILNENGEEVGAYFNMDGQFGVLATKVDNFEWNYVCSYEDNGEIYEESYPLFFPEKGIYTAILDYEEDDSGEIIKYYTFDKILFRDVKPIDKDLLPSEALSPVIEVEDYVNSDSDNPISSRAVHYALQNKIDRPWNMQEGYVFGVQNGTLQLMSPPQTGVSEHTFNQAITEINNKIPKIPTVSSSDNGKFMMVQNGVWTAVTIPFAEEEEY